MTRNQRAAALSLRHLRQMLALEACSFLDREPDVRSFIIVDPNFELNIKKVKYEDLCKHLYTKCHSP